MATIQTPVHVLLTTPFTHPTDFTELADNCERYVEVLVESRDPAEKLALCGRLGTCLALLKPTLLEPVPVHLRDALTVDEPPTTLPEFAPEVDSLCHYCQVLTDVTLSGMLNQAQQRVVDDLLFELVSYFSAIVKAPRWLMCKPGEEPVAL